MSDKSIKYSPAKLKKFKSILNDRLKTITDELDTYKSRQKEQKRRVANTNTGFSEGSKHFQQQAKNKQIIRRLQRKSRELNSALDRIEDKSYGVCDRTGKLIREARLMAMPTARFDISPKS